MDTDVKRGRGGEGRLEMGDGGLGDGADIGVGGDERAMRVSLKFA